MDLRHDSGGVELFFTAASGYAAIFNRNEQEGVNDIGAHIWRLFGYDVEPEGKEKNLIRFQPGIGTDYLNF